MKKNSSNFFKTLAAISVLLSAGCLANVHAQQSEVPVKLAMLEVYQAFKGLQPYLQSEEEFVKSENRKAI